ncbi:thiamine-monophosphate kinase [Caulobacter ginsengisoli]|uniref:Thiamine-monophosphate kinase n=2 Tax=Caulobacter ginsengisoli TaxID=400775 RepID=A0ABU0IMJ1_9CAUL|nr:thiamine-phosphate kinase [Caulobacter ginsengisoli]MDQ0463220.1 thiamine-monophosphate kinase [Caulobacter ginsengisoli]
MSEPVDEFDWIARLLRPLTRGAPEAFDLLDDAALIPEIDEANQIVVTSDCLVEGVHFLASDRPDMVARKLLRVNLSDLAAKGAVPFGYLMTVAWPRDADWRRRQMFAKGLATDQGAFGLSLLGGDTVSTPGPWTLSATMMGRVDPGGMVRRGGGKPGDLLVVSGMIGDGWLGLKALQGEFTEPDSYLVRRYQLPEPRLGWRVALRHASAAADVSDGLLADAGHIATASGCGLEIELERLPLSPAAARWLERQEDQAGARIALATGGDDYEIVCAVAPQALEAFQAEVGAVPATVVGRLTEGEQTTRFQGEVVTPDRLGWSH